MNRTRLVEGIILMLLLSVCLTAANIMAFVLKTPIAIYLVFSGLSGLLFAISIKNLKWGLFYVCLSVFLAALFSWVCVTSPALIYGEGGMMSYMTEVFVPFIARMSVLSFPVVVFTLLLGSLMIEGV